MKQLLGNDKQQVVANGNPYLCKDCILRRSEERLDVQVLLDPLEEQLNLSPVFLEQGDVLCTEVEVVRVVYEAAMKFRSIIDNPSDDSRVFLLVLFFRETNTLVFEHVVSSVKQTFFIDNLVCRLALFPNNEECAEDTSEFFYILPMRKSFVLQFSLKRNLFQIFVPFHS